MKFLYILITFQVLFKAILSSYDKTDKILESIQLETVADYVLGQHYSNDIVSLTNNNYGIAYLGADQKLYASFLKFAQKLPGSPTNIIQQAGGEIQASTTCAINTDKMMVIYTLKDDGPPSVPHQVYGRVINIDGTFDGNEFLISHSVLTSTVGRCRQISSSKVVISYGLTEAAPLIWEEYIKVYDLGTKTLAAEYKVNDKTDGYQTYGFTFKTTDNKIVHLFSEYGGVNSSAKGLYIQELDVNGAKSGANRAIPNTEADMPIYVKASPTSDGGFMLVYEHDESIKINKILPDYSQHCFELIDASGFKPDIEVYEDIAYISYASNDRAKGVVVNTTDCTIMRQAVQIDDNILASQSINQALSFDGSSVILGVFYKLGGPPYTLQYTEYLIKQLQPCTDSRCAGCYHDLNSCPLCTGSTPEQRVIREDSNGGCTCKAGYKDIQGQIDCEPICADNCTSCTEPNTCDVCQDGYYRDYSKRCMQCKKGCETCDNGSTCFACNNGGELPACNVAQQVGKFTEVVNGQLVYSDCAGQCHMCETSAENCTSCKDQFQDLKNGCSCQEGFQMNDKGMCDFIPCESGFYQFNHKCIKCFWVQGSDQCYEEKCPFEYEVNSDTKECVKEALSITWMIIFLIIGGIVIIGIIAMIISRKMKNKNAVKYQQQQNDPNQSLQQV